jgi:cysteine synthase B
MKLIDAIGNTALVEVNSPNPQVKIFAKLEGANPGGSVKDRAVKNMLLDALAEGKISPGDELIEATSGNTGIALAMLATQLNLQINIVLPENSSVERIETMKAYGAKLILTPAEKGIEYSRILAEETRKKKKLKGLDQFSNDANWRAHYETTGPEIWQQTAGEISHFVSAMGTTGTIMGTGRYLKEQNPSINVIGAQPKEGASIPGIRKWSKKLEPRIYNAKEIDVLFEVNEKEAHEALAALSKKEGIFAGISTGAAYHISQKVALSIQTGTVVFINCDKGDRYLSTKIYN